MWAPCVTRRCGHENEAGDRPLGRDGDVGPESASRRECRSRRLEVEPGARHGPTPPPQYRRVAVRRKSAPRPPSSRAVTAPSPRLAPDCAALGHAVHDGAATNGPATGRPLSAQSTGASLLGSRRPNGRSGSAPFAPAPTPRRERRDGSPRCGPCRSNGRARCRAWRADGGYGHRPCASRRCSPRPTPRPEAPRGSAPAPD